MGKLLCHLLAPCCLIACMINGHPIFAQAKSGVSDTSGTVPLIYFQAPRRTTTTATSSVAGADLAKMPVASYPLALAGRIAGLNITQSTGQPLGEDYSMNLRGQSPLILIDGIPRALTEIGMQEIASITLLKDAVATAMLGVRGANGALLVTTKKGYAGKQTISVNIQTGIAKPINNTVSAPLDAYRYAQLYNEALTNDGLPVAGYGFDQTALDAFKSGSDPIKYPNVNWKDQVLKNSAFTARYNVNARGGNQFVKYFVSLEHFKQNGLLQTSAANKYNTNADLAGYFARSNADLQLTDNLSAGIYIQGRLVNTSSPGNNGTDGIFSSLLTTPAAAYPVYNKNGSYAGNTFYQNNIRAQTVGAGYTLNNVRTILSDFYLKGKLDNITKGLWARVRASFFSNLSEKITRSKSNAVFEQTGTTVDGDAVYRQYGSNTVQSNANALNFQNRSDFQELSVGYNRGFGDHLADVVLLANRDNLINGSNLPYTIQGISGHGSYSYKKKYLLDLSFGINGANRYYDDGSTKYGFFPAIGLGWNLKEERFMQGAQWLDRLKLYGSYGKLGQDNAYYFTYQQVYNAAPASIFGSSAAQATTIGESYLANPAITWEKAKKLNLGIEAAILKELLSFQVEYYNNRYADLSITRGTSNAILGISYPVENIGKQRYSGIEAQLTLQHNNQHVGYNVALNAAFQRSALVYGAEVFQQYDWMNRTGMPVGQRFGYVAEGLFQSQQEINGHATIEGYQPQPGDIKYKDLNGDGVINQYDQAAIGKKNNPVLLGATLGINFHQFDLSLLLQGRCNREVYLSDNSYWEFQNGATGQAYEHHLNRWTPSNTAADYPRLTTGRGPANGDANNWVTSSYWLRNGNYLRMKYVELGYQVPDRYLKKIGFTTARFYVNAYNLLTLASSSLNGADPENYTGNYPVQKVVNLGVNIQL